MKLPYKFANKIADIISHPYTLIIVILSLIGGFVIGYFLHFNEHWFKIFEFTIYVITFVMVFIIEASEHSDTHAIQHKLDEIIKALPNAKNEKMGIEEHLKQGKSIKEAIESNNE